VRPGFPDVKSAPSATKQQPRGSLVRPAHTLGRYFSGNESPRASTKQRAPRWRSVGQDGRYFIQARRSLNTNPDGVMHRTKHVQMLRRCNRPTLCVVERSNLEAAEATVRRDERERLAEACGAGDPAREKPLLVAGHAVRVYFAEERFRDEVAVRDVMEVHAPVVAPKMLDAPFAAIDFGEARF